MLLRVGRGFVIVTDDAAFPMETRHYPSIWLSTVLGAPFVLRRLVVLFWIATTARSTCRVGRRLTRTTDDFPGENWNHLCAV